MHTIWHNMFGLELPLLEKVLRPVGETKQAELRHRLDRISQQLADLQRALDRGR